MPEDVKIKLRASLGLDASDVQKSMQAIQEQLQPKTAGPIDATEQAMRWVERVIGKTGTFVEGRKKLLASYAEEVAYVRKLEGEYQKMLRTKGGLDEIDKRVEGGLVRSHRERLNRIRDLIQVGTTAEKAEPHEEQGGGILSTLSGGAGGIFGAIKAAISKHPYIAAAVGVGLAAKYLKGKADEYSEYSEKLETGFDNTGRRMGYGVGLRGQLETGGPGRVSPRMKALGYSGEDALKMAGAYGMPGKGLGSALEAQGGFARAFGFGENPETISGMGRRATQIGMDDQPAFWRTMTEAVTTGLKHGVDASETMRALLGLTEDVAAHTGVVSRDYLSGLSGIQKAFEGGMSKFFKGETGADQLKTVMGAFTHPSGVAQQRFMQNAIMGQFGGKVPSSSDIGFTGAGATSYDQMTELQKMQTVMARLPELMTSKNPKVSGLMAHMARQVSKAAPPGGEMLMWQSILGMEPAKLQNAHEALSGIVGGKDAGARGFGDLLETAFKKAPDQARKALAGQAAPSEITPMEQKEQLRREATEVFSMAISESTFNLRKFTEQLAASTTSLAADILHSGHEGTLGDTVKGYLKSLLPDSSKGGGNGGGKGREQLLIPQAEATPQLQGWSGSSMQMQPLLISGTIELTGAGEGAVPAAMFLPILQQAIEQYAARTRSMGTSRPRQMGTVGI